MKSALALALAVTVSVVSAGTTLTTLTSLTSPPSATAAAAADLITNLPDAPTVDFNQYAGYLTVDESHGRELFYMFTEAENNPEGSPFVLWLNGGPGCSSLAGYLTEHGALRPTASGKLEANPYAWNKVANVLYIESPAGVGFSVSQDEADYTTGDARTANDAYVALLQFFERYPKFKTNEFWVAGESYAGHYVPQLTARIVEGNKQSPAAQKINIQGFLVGNAWTDPALDNLGAVDMWYSHALISRETYDGMKANCDFSNVGPLLKKITAMSTNKDPRLCQQFSQATSTEMGDINIYQIYEDVCHTTQVNAAQTLASYTTADTPLQAVFALESEELVDGRGKAPPCIDNYATAYLSRPEVQTALHAKKLGYDWTQCSSRVKYNRKDVLSSVIPVYEGLLEHGGLKMLVFSGDVDGIVPVPGTRYWMEGLKLKVEEKWRPWTASGQVGGYVVGYEKGLTFATVRNAGHMVPGTQPERALHMLKAHITGQPM